MPPTATSLYSLYFVQDVRKRYRHNKIGKILGLDFDKNLSAFIMCGVHLPLVVHHLASILSRRILYMFIVLSVSSISLFF